MDEYIGDYVTLTFVVRKGRELEEDEDPRVLLTNDEVMFWGGEPGITQHALDLGADPALWDGEEDDIPGLAGLQRERYYALVEHVGHDAAVEDAREWPVEAVDL